MKTDKVPTAEEMESADNRKIYELKLHQILHLDNGMSVMRVPGGWIYFYKIWNIDTFVPYCNDFQDSEQSSIDLPF